MTAFIESIATQQLMPPYQATGATVSVFLIEIDPETIQNYCDKFLNIGTEHDTDFFYTPLGSAPFGLLTFTTYPNFFSKNRVNMARFGSTITEWDHLSQNELFAAVPVQKYRRTSSNCLFDPVLEWVQPFVVVDNPTSAFSGREILGLEVLQGQMEVTTGQAPDTFKAAVALPSWWVFGPNSPQQMLPFFEVETRTPWDPKSPGFQNPDTATFLERIRAAIPSAAADSGGMYPATDMTFVTLKQYRDAGDPARAVYQAIISARCVYTNITQGKLYEPPEISVVYTRGAMVNEIVSTFLGQKDPLASLADLPFPLSTLFADFPTQPMSCPLAFSFTCDISVDDVETRCVFRNESARSGAPLSA